MKLLIATKNLGKFQEIRELLGGVKMELVSLEDLGIGEDFPEEGSSFEENALGKAHFYGQLSGLPTVADDSGIFVEALAGELGVKTRRWGAGETASDEEWLKHFLARMQPEANRQAHFICAAAYSGPLGDHVFMGDTRGVLAEQVEAPIKQGIPLSSIFRPEGYDKVYAALTVEEKNRLSHRGKAFAQLLNFLKNA